MIDRLLTEADAMTSPANTIFASSVTVNAGYSSSAGLHAAHLTPEKMPIGTVVDSVITLTNYVIQIGVPSRRQYLLSERDAITAGDPATVISPAWLQKKKQQLQGMIDLPANWDSYGARTPTPASLNQAQVLLLWLAVADVPPPDLFPTVDGGVQIEWHVHGLNAEVAIAPDADETRIYYQDLRTGEEWERPLSSARQELRTIRSRLLQQHGERP